MRGVLLVFIPLSLLTFGLKAQTINFTLRAKVTGQTSHDAPFALNEPQGERPCFSAGVDGYYTISETQKSKLPTAHLSFYKRK